MCGVKAVAICSIFLAMTWTPLHIPDMVGFLPLLLTLGITRKVFADPISTIPDLSLHLERCGLRSEQKERGACVLCGKYFLPRLFDGSPSSRLQLFQSCFKESKLFGLELPRFLTDTYKPIKMDERCGRRRIFPP